MCFCVRTAVCTPRSLQSCGDFSKGRIRVVSRSRWRWNSEAASRFRYELGHVDRVQVKVVKQPAFVLNSSDGEFKPLCEKLSQNFQWRVRLQINLTRIHRAGWCGRNLCRDVISRSKLAWIGEEARAPVEVERPRKAIGEQLVVSNARAETEACGCRIQEAANLSPRSEERRVGK